MSKKRKQYSAQFKFRVAMEAVIEDKTITELASEYLYLFLSSAARSVADIVPEIKR